MLLNSKIIITQMIAIFLFSICNRVLASDLDNQLLKAVCNRDANEVSKLLGAKANVDTIGNAGETPLIMASSIGCESIVRLLVDSKAKLDEQSICGAAINHAVNSGHHSIFKVLLDSKAYPNTQDNNRLTPLASASHRGNDNAIRRLLAAKSDTEIKDYSGKTAIVWASILGHKTAVNLLLNAGANPNEAGKDGKTALNWAISKGHHYIAEKIRNFY